MSEHRKCLRTLGLQDGATESEIRSAYRKLALQYHPDKNESDDAKERFQEIGYAYKYLTVGPGHQTGSPFEREDDVVIHMFREMFFAQFMQQRFGFPFMYDDDSDEDDDYYYYSDDSEDEYRYGPFCGHMPRSGSSPQRSWYTGPPPPNIYQEETKKQKKKREKHQRQKERAKEKKEQLRKSGADKSSASNTAENAEGAAETPNPAPTSQEQSAPTQVQQSSQKLTKKQKKQLETQQRKREEEMKRIAEELLCKQEQEKERQREKEREKREKEKLEKREQPQELEKGPDNETIECPVFYDHGKKSRKARQRERRCQEAEASVNMPSPTTNSARSPGSVSSSSSRTTNVDTAGTGPSSCTAPDQSDSGSSLRSSTPLSFPSTVSSTIGSDNKARKSRSKPDPSSEQKKSRQTVGGTQKGANRFQVLDDLDDTADVSDPNTSQSQDLPQSPQPVDNLRGFGNHGNQDTATNKESNASASPRHDHSNPSSLRDRNTGSSGKSSNEHQSPFSPGKGSYSTDSFLKNSQASSKGNPGSYSGNNGPKNDNHRFYNGNHGSYNCNQGSFTGPNKGRDGPFNDNPGPYNGQGGPYAASHGPYTNNHGSYYGGHGSFGSNYGPYADSGSDTGQHVYYSSHVHGNSNNHPDNRYNNGPYYPQSQKRGAPRQPMPHMPGGRSQQGPREGQSGRPQFTFSKGGFPRPKCPGSSNTESSQAIYRASSGGEQNHVRNNKETFVTQYNGAYGAKTVPVNARKPQTTPFSPQHSAGVESNRPSSWGDSKPAQYTWGATLENFDDKPRVVSPGLSPRTTDSLQSDADLVDSYDSLDSLDDLSLYDPKGSGAGSNDLHTTLLYGGNEALGLGDTVLNSGLGVPAGMLTDSIKNYYK